MEQWLARWAHNPKVGGSNPPPATSFLLFYLSKHQQRGIEQWLARRAHNPEVAGSNPVPATSQKKRPRPAYKQPGAFLSTYKSIAPTRDIMELMYKIGVLTDEEQEKEKPVAIQHGEQ